MYSTFKKKSKQKYFTQLIYNSRGHTFRQRFISNKKYIRRGGSIITNMIIYKNAYVMK